MIRFIFVMTLLTLATGCRQEQETQQKLDHNTIQSVLVQQASFGNYQVPTAYAGEVSARYESNLAFRISGKIIARYVDVGHQVKPGTLLAKLDPVDMELNVQAAQAQVAAAEERPARRGALPARRPQTGQRLCQNRHTLQRLRCG